MRALMLTGVIAALTLTGCETAPGGMSGPAIADNGNDCAVIAAVAREHYRFGPDNVAPPLWLDGWAPRCDWSRHGVSFPRTYDPDRPFPGSGVDQWVSFERPTYDGRGAVVKTSIVHGPLAGMGYECRVISGFAGWTVPEGSCRNTWVS